MAIGRGGKIGSPEDSGYLSDESDFYGDEAAKRDLEARAANFSVSEGWENMAFSPTAMAEANLKTTVKKKEATLYNPYEGQFCGRQLNETVEEFLQRLPPQTTPVSDLVPWIFIANPYRKAPNAEDGQEIKGEGPPEEESDWAQFVVLGGNMLEELTGIRHDIEKEKPGKAKATVTKAYNPHKDLIVQKLLDTAAELHCTSGKWMMFVDPIEINIIWSVIARHTANNELGIAAKVAPDDGDLTKPRLICIYTKDFKDIDDIHRVAKKMKDIGLIDLRKPLWYKCDAYTYLGLNSKNEYGIKASLYSSTEVLNPKEQKKLDG